ncbi:uncharacterized protein N7482_002935 [Penicillium canariense]|uniref:Uncharacterized protein n=1 Tax=Penicillium canariense TaxID=189055 RepID=A0A9W9IHZ4_9EURO|nr:uncharacterized protein N7482_002935 [Penicillium canariense]KAJ5177058.1 hypothetical protein N7482_002935 [Penicillium canariense]
MDASSLPDFKVLSYPTKWCGIDSDRRPSPSDEITLNATSSWTYCGPLLPLDPKSLPSSFDTWAQATVNGPLLGPLFSFLEFVHEFLKANDISHYWLTIRASQGSDEFDIPRWHTDDLFFSPLATAAAPATTTPALRHSFLWPFADAAKRHRRASSLSHTRRSSQSVHTRSPQPTPPQLPPSVQISSSTTNPPNWKLTTTLLGPGTLFISLPLNPHARNLQSTTKLTVRTANPGHICLSIRCVGCATAAEEVRATLAAQLGGHRDGAGVVQAARGECVFFRVGEDEGAVHSEPMSRGERVFVNVVPGFEKDLRCLMAKWGMEFPRAWCVGLPFQGVEGGCWRNVGEI